MSAINKGDQILTFDFRQDATSTNFNKYNSNIVKPGIYKGGRVYFQQYTSGVQTLYRYIIEPFSAAFLVSEGTLTTEVNKKLLVNVTTNSDSEYPSALPTNNNDPVGGVPGINQDYYLTISLDWVKTLNNYLNFLIVDDLDNLSANQLVVCRIRGNGASKKPDIYYDATSYGSYYESYDDKFVYYNNNVNVLNSNYGQYVTDPQKLRKLIPLSSNAYYLKFNGYTGTDNYEFITFQPFNGELEMINKNNYQENMKFIFDVSGNINIIASAKTKLVNNANRVQDYISYNVDQYGRLKIYNGYTSAREYIVKTNIFNISRKLNTAQSLD